MIWEGPTSTLGIGGIGVTKIDLNTFTIITDKYPTRNKSNTKNESSITSNSKDVILISYTSNAGDNRNNAVITDFFDNCPITSYANTSRDNICEPCDYKCNGCVGSPKSCSSCRTGYYKKDDIKYSECSKTVPTGYYLNTSTNYFSKCNTACSTCETTSSNCLTCAINHYYKNNSIDKLCYLNSSPPTGYFYNSGYHYPCKSECAVCPDANSCTTCNTYDGYYPLEDDAKKCYLTCPDGYWKNTASQLCSKCDLSCKICKDSKFVCDVCAANYYPKSDLASSCHNTPPDETYSWDARNSTWYRCPSINNIFIPELSICVSTCPENYYHSTADNKCLKCDSNCRSCSSTKLQCSGCNLNMYLDNNSKTCVSYCPKEYYGNTVDYTCQPCDPTCLTCKGPYHSDCLSCAEDKGLRLNKGYCNSDCSDNLLKIKNSDDCFDFFQCFDNLYLSMPKLFSIELINYKAALIYKLNAKCLSYASELSIKWYGIPENYISKDFQSVEIAYQNLKEDNYNLKAEISYNNSLITSLSGNSFLVINKVFLKFFKF